MKTKNFHQIYLIINEFKITLAKLVIYIDFLAKRK
jgi:hypothetical protein